MRLFIVILLILFGSFLIGLTIDSFGKIGNFIMNLIGAGINLLAVLLRGTRKKNSIPFKQNII